MALVLAEAGRGRGQEEPTSPVPPPAAPLGLSLAQAAGCVQPAEVAGASWSPVSQGPVVQPAGRSPPLSHATGLTPTWSPWLDEFGLIL